MIISMIAAATQNGVIAKDGEMPWHMPNDLRYFRRKTLRHHVIMGRKTFEEFGKSKPLPKRTNIVVTRQKNFIAEGCFVVNSVEAGLAIAKANGDAEAYIIGGAQIYTLGMALCDRIYLTQIETVLEGDTFFPEIDENKWKIVWEEAHQADEKNVYDYVFTLWERKQ